MPKAIHVFGPPGSGKGTQANLLAEHLGGIHFDTGRYLEELIKNNDPRISEEEKKKWNEGELNDPKMVLHLVKEKTKEIYGDGKTTIYSGSPRTTIEAFGDEATQGLMNLLSDLYGKKNILIFKLNIPAESSIERNSKRLICTKCKKENPYENVGAQKCVFCGGELYKRTLDDPKVIEVRLKEYEERTNPVFKGLQDNEYKVLEIDGTPTPEKVFENIKKHLG